MVWDMNNRDNTPQLTQHILFVNVAIASIDEITSLLKDQGELDFDYHQVQTDIALEKAFKGRAWDIIFYDITRPLLPPADFIHRCRDAQPDATLILLYEQMAVQNAVDMMRLGASAVVQRADYQKLLDIVQQDIKVPRDIQELALVNEELATYKIHFSAVLDTMQDALFSTTLPDRKTVFVSQSFERIFGYPYARIKEDPQFFRQIVHPDDLERTLAAQQQCLIDGFAELDHRIIWPDGQVRWLHRRAWINYDDNGNPVRVNDSARDITDWKTSQLELQERETNLANLFNTIDDFLFILDENRNLVEVNRTVIKRLGYSKQELLGQDVLVVHPTEYHAEAIAIIDEILNGTRESCPLPLQAKDGTQIPVETHVTQGEWNGKLALFGLSKDISELKLSEERFEAIFRTNPAIVGLSSIETGEYVEVNEAFCEKLGFTMDEVIGANAAELLQLDPEWGEETLQKLITQGYVRDEETVILAKDGTPVPVYLSAEVISLHGKSYNFTTAVDISDLKKAENELLLQKEHLKSLIDSQTNYLVRLDMEGRYTYWNPKFEQDFGWVYDEIGIDGSPVLQTIVPYHHQRMLDTVQKCLLDPSMPFQVELDKVSSNNAYRTLLWEFVCLTDSKNTPIGFQCIGIDISELKQAQETVQHQANILQQISDAVITFDNDYKITSWNKVATEIYGWTEQEAIGHRMADLVKAEVLAGDHASAIASFSQTGHWYGDLREFDKQGNELYVISSVNQLSNKYGEPVGGVIINRDITAKKLSEKQILIQNEFLHQSRDLIAMADANGIITYMNQGGATLLGANAPEDLIGRPLTDTHPPEDAERTIREYVPHAMKTGYWRGENRLKALDGRVIDVDQTMFSIVDTEGNVVSAAAIIVDISERKKAENALRASEDRYRQMFELVNLPKLITDPHTAKILDANPAAVEFYGYSLQTLKSMTMLEINIAESDVVLDKMRKVVSGEIGKCEFEQRLANGTTRFVEGYAGLINHLGQDALYCTYIDVTERNRAQAALKQINLELEQRVEERTTALKASKDRIEAIFNHSADGILLLDAELHIEQCNYACDQLFDFMSEEYFNTTLLDLMSDEGRIKLKTLLPNVVEKHQVKQLEICAKRKDGSLFDAEISIAPINRSNEPVKNIVCIIRDITERKQGEAERQQHIAEIEELYNHAPAGYHSLDPTGLIIQINDTELDWLGYTRAEVLGKRRFSEFLTPTSQKHFREKFQLLRKTGELSGIEFEMVCKDGTTIWVLGSARVAYTENGEFLRSHATLYNITELRKAQAALAEERNLLRTVIDAVPNFIYVKNMQHEIILNNKSHSEFISTRVMGEYQKGTYMDAFSKKLQEKIKLTEIQIIATGVGVYDIEDVITSEDGTLKWLSTTKIPLRNLQDEVIGVVGITSDISHLKQQEALIRESEARYRMTVENMSEGLIVQSKDGAIQLSNAAAENILGLTSEQLIGRSSLDSHSRAIYEDGSVFPGEQHPAMVTLRTGKPQSNVVMGVYKPDGVLRWIEINSRPLDQADNNPLAVVVTFVDITERKLAELALKHSEERYRMLAENVKDVILRMNIQSYVTFATPSIVDMLGYTPEEAIAMNGFNIVHPDDADTIQQIMRDAIQAKAKSFVLEERLQHKDGHYIWVDAAVNIIYDSEDQTPVSMIGVLRDITERKRAEQEVRSVSERLQLATKAGGIGIWDWNTPENIMLWDAQMYKLYGIDDRYFTGTVEVWEQMLHPDDAPRAKAEVEAALRGEKRFDTEFRVVTPAGDLRHIRAHANVYRDADGAPIRMVGVNMDITSQKTAVLALRTSEEKFRMFIESAPIATIISNLKNEIVIVNDATERLFGYGREELIGESINRLVPEESKDTHDLLMQEFVSEKDRQRAEVMELSARHKSGHVFSADIQLSRVTIEPEPLIMSFVIDITRRKEAEQTLKQALEKEKELGKLKSQFVSTASHQFRTPLAAILASTESLTVYRDRMNQTQIEDRLDRIRSQVTYMKGLMNDVLELARIQANQIQYKPKPCDFDKLCREIIGDYSQQDKYRDRIVYEGPATAITSQLDEHLLHHVVSNLIHNALKYSPEEESVYIHLTYVENEIIFKVEDRGIGIPEDDINNLFIPFSRAGNVGSTEGTGLGLSIVKQSIEAHQGTIEVKTAVDVGTTFIVKIPYQSIDA